MTKTYRAGNGKFVSKTNPVAVIGRLNEARRVLAEVPAQDRRKNGYRGPLTRAQLAQMTLGDNT